MLTARATRSCDHHWGRLHSFMTTYTPCQQCSLGWVKALTATFTSPNGQCAQRRKATGITIWREQTILAILYQALVKVKSQPLKHTKSSHFLWFIPRSGAWWGAAPPSPPEVIASISGQLTSGSLFSNFLFPTSSMDSKKYLAKAFVILRRNLAHVYTLAGRVIVCSFWRTYQPA